MSAKITLGFATIDDPMAWATVTELRMVHAEVMDQCEILAVDNDPDGPRGKNLKQLLQYWCSDPKRGQGRYVAHKSVPSTAQPRNRVFQEAQTPYVVCMDSHVFLPAGTVKRLIEFFDAGLDGGNLLQGPLLYDSLDPDGMSTHFTDLWEAEMWGQWRTSWDCPCGHFRFDVHRVAGATFRPLMGGEYVTGCPVCHRTFPVCQFERHEDHLASAGFKRSHDSDDPFEVPMQGLGLFACRKDAWLGFNPQFSGFGGEEGYIHQKYRNAGKKTLCLPWLRWPHKFGEAQDRGYTPKRDDKVRNYVIGFREVGLPLDPIHKHFVEDGGMPEETWGKILDGSYGPATMEQWDAHVAQQKASILVNGQQVATVANPAPPATYPPAPAATTTHASKLRSLAAACERVTAFEMAPGTNTLALAVAGAKSLVAYAFQPNDTITQQMLAVRGETDIDFRNSHSLGAKIEETDMLFLDTLHNALHVENELKRHAPKVRRWIAVFRTQRFGLTGEHGAGMLFGLHKFLGESPEWQAVYHSLEADGLTILSREKADWLPHPVLPVPIAPPQGQQAAPGAPAQVIQPPSEGPGTEFKLIMEKLGIEAGEGCDCKARQSEMNMAGTKGCRERFDYFVAILKDGSPRWGWKDRLAVKTKAVVTGLFLELDSWDTKEPIPPLLRLAIKRAEAKERAAKQEPARAA